jgi:hypothetical protein
VTLVAGTRLGGYDILALIGAGGMSACGYAAHVASLAQSLEPGA